MVMKSVLLQVDKPTVAKKPTKNVQANSVNKIWIASFTSIADPSKTISSSNVVLQHVNLAAGAPFQNKLAWSCAKMIAPMGIANHNPLWSSKVKSAAVT